MSDDGESELRALFQRQRAKDQASAHAFDRVLERSAHRDNAQARVAPRLAFVGAASLVLVIGALVVIDKRSEVRRAGSPEMLAALTSTVWRAPTDFLLEVPASELTESVPSFDASLPGLAGSGARPRSTKTP